MTMEAPSLARASTTALPMPLLPPVTMATFPSSVMVLLSGALGRIDRWGPGLHPRSRTPSESYRPGPARTGPTATAPGPHLASSGHVPHHDGRCHRRAHGARPGAG